MDKPRIVIKTKPAARVSIKDTAAGRAINVDAVVVDHVSDNYENLKNLPSINGVRVVGALESGDLKVLSAAFSDYEEQSAAALKRGGVYLLAGDGDGVYRTSLDGFIRTIGGTITGDLSVAGDLVVSGTTITEKSKTLSVEDSVIVSNANGTALGATLAGLAIRKDGTHTYGIMYDPATDSVKLGLGTLGEGNKFTFSDGGSDGKPIATRADSANLIEGHLMEWDGTTKSLVDSGKSVDSFVPKLKNEEANNKFYAEFGSYGTRLIAGTTGSFSNALVLRDSNGCAKIKTPTADEDIANKKYVDDGFRKKFTVGAGEYAYIANASGDGSLQIDGASNAYTIAKRGANGVLKVGTPLADADAVNLLYANSMFVAKISGTPTHRSVSIVDKDSSGNWNYQWYRFEDNATEWTFPRRVAGGVVRVGTPVLANDATTKQYVDAAINTVNTITIAEGA